MKKRNTEREGTAAAQPQASKRERIAGTPPVGCLLGRNEAQTNMLENLNSCGKLGKSIFISDMQQPIAMHMVLASAARSVFAVVPHLGVQFAIIRKPPHESLSESTAAWKNKLLINTYAKSC